eukprot:CCRYP_003910-RA/>CCRYP_003910-RA protein AED:0.27 eAED:0.27 QI:476/1/1/1/1/1/3/193/521
MSSRHLVGRHHNIVISRNRIRRRFSQQTAQRILFICWIITILSIWIATDGDEDISDSAFNTMNYGPPAIRKDAHQFVSHQSNNSQSDSFNMQIHVQDLILDPPTTEALRPISYNNCCIPAIMMGSANPNDIKCFGTCYNERACSDPTYPYSSLEEREKFGQLVTLDPYQINLTKCRCLAEPEWLIPNVTWCSKSAKGIYGSNPSPGCSLVSDSHGGPWQHVFVFPSAKLAFCGIPKVGITKWIQFARFAAGAKDYPSIPHYKLDIEFFRYDKMDPLIQQEIWQNEKEWTWAVFIRDPAERVLSAYLDKVATKSGQANVKRLYGFDRFFSFEDFIKRLNLTYIESGCATKELEKKPESGMTGLTLCSNPHWRPQIMSCGLYERLDRFKFVGDIHNSPDHTRELLKAVGLWESHGKHFINGGVTRDGKTRLHDCSIKSYPSTHKEHVGFQQKDQVFNFTASNTVYGHATGSKDKMESYYTPDLLKLVREKLYADDDKLYQMVSGMKKLSRGEELAALLSDSGC